MYKTISNEIIRQFKPCYDPSELITDETEELTVTEWIKKYRDVVPAADIVWLLSRKEFLSEKDLRLFAVWNARETLKLIVNPDKRSVEACNVAEKFANGEATEEELHIAFDAALNAEVSASNAANVAYASDAAAYAADAAAYAADAAAYAADDDAHAADYAAGASASASAAAYYTSASDVSADIAYAAFRTSQINKLLTYFK
jgi:hypothetical protein